MDARVVWSIARGKVIFTGLMAPETTRTMNPISVPAREDFVAVLRDMELGCSGLGARFKLVNTPRP
jgi:hypothetical protein